MVILFRFTPIVITSARKSGEGSRASCPEKKLNETEGEGGSWEELVAQCPPMDT